MRLALGLESRHLPSDGCVATIGNFDGVHRGHRAVIEQLAERASRLGLPGCVVLFEPQPMEYFAPEQSPPRLMRLIEKVDRLSELPVDHVLLLRFNRRLAALEAEAFIQTILVDTLRIRHLVIGDDFRFGRQRRGDFDMLKRAGKVAGFEVDDTPSVLMEGERVSSTLIRNALAMGDLAHATRLLGKPYEVCGRVVHGHKRGRLMGFPTANLLMRRKNTPVQGVFAVTMRGLGGDPMPGVANVGVRPTVTGDPSVILETHVLDFAGDLYGRKVEIEFHRKLREERRFDGLPALCAQIELDIQAARAFFAETAINPSLAI